MPFDIRVHIDLFMILFHLLEFCSIRVMDKIETIRSRRFKSKNNITFIILEHQMDIILAFFLF